MPDDKPDAADAAEAASPPAADAPSTTPSAPAETATSDTVDAKPDTAIESDKAEGKGAATPDEFVDATDAPAAAPSTPPKAVSKLPEDETAPAVNGDGETGEKAKEVELGSPIAEIKKRPTALQLDEVHAPPRSSIEVSSNVPTCWRWAARRCQPATIRSIMSTADVRRFPDDLLAVHTTSHVNTPQLAAPCACSCRSHRC